MSSHTTDNDFAPADQEEFYKTVAAPVIRSPLVPDVSFEYISSSRFQESQPGVIYPGRYTYEKTGPDTATIELYYDDGDRATNELKYLSATSLDKSPSKLLPGLQKLSDDQIR